MSQKVTVVGGGLAGSEAAWQLARAGLNVDLFEMRPRQQTPAHVTDHLAELVCSNSLGSFILHKAPGLLKAELRGLGSLLLDCAAATAVPAGFSLAVDRDRFAALVTERIAAEPQINVMREEVTSIPAGPTIIATGPLTAAPLAAAIGALSSEEYLYFYDALAPIVDFETIDLSIAFRASRHDKGEQTEGDYINCPLNEEEYDRFWAALRDAETIELKQFEREDPHFFEGCLPIEVLARRDHDALRYGPMRPIGIIDPRTGRRPFAVAQLRQDNLAGSLFNIVGFQTNLRWGEQRRVLRLLPGLESAEFMRFGMMHRNTYVNAPKLLAPTLQYRGRADLFFAGQITGVEGYAGNVGTGLLAGINAARLVQGHLPLIMPTKTMLGALCHYVTHADAKHFQPMKANFGILPPLVQRLSKGDRYRVYSERGLTALRRFARENDLTYDEAAALAVTDAMPAVVPVSGPTPVSGK